MSLEMKGRLLRLLSCQFCYLSQVFIRCLSHGYPYARFFTLGKFFDFYFFLKVISYQENEVFILKSIKRIVIKKEETSLQG